MADHNTLIGSTGREIESGTVLLGGVVREIESGKTLVGGVARDIEFAPTEAVMTIEGISQAWVIEIKWDGGSYNNTKKDGTYAIPIGTVITFGVPWYANDSNTVYLNGVNMYNQMYRGTISASKRGGFYDYVLNGNITVTFSTLAANIYITEE